MRGTATLFPVVLLVAFVLGCLHPCTAARADVPVYAAFTYQGQLRFGDEPHAGAVDLAFRLYDAATDGTQVGPQIMALAFDGFDDEGRFTIDLAFGKGAFTGAPRWLEIDVGGATLSPRQPIMPAPYAIRALNVNAVPDEAMTGTFSNPVGFTNPGNQFAGSFTGTGSGLTGLNASAIASGILGGARLGGSYVNAVTFANADNVFVGNGFQLTNLNAAALTGVLPNAVLSGTYTNQLIFGNPANLFAGSGALLTQLNASNISSGTLHESRLSDALLARLPDEAFALTAGSALAMPSSTTAMVVADGRLYVCAFGGQSLRIYGLESPLSPEFLGSVVIAPGPRGLDVAGNYAYIARDQFHGFGALRVVDVSTPEAPVIVGDITVPGVTQANDVLVASGYAYLACSDGTLRTFSLADPTTPVQVATLALGAAPYALARSADRLVTTSFIGGTMQVLSIADPAQPVLLGSAATSANPNAIAAAGDTVAVTTQGGGGLELFSISDPSNPGLVGSLVLGTGLRSVRIARGHAMVINFSTHVLEAYDIADPTNPVLVDSIPTTTQPFRMAASSSHAYVASNAPALEAFSLNRFSFGGQLASAQFVGSGAGLTSLNAASLSSGMLDAARLPTGGVWQIDAALSLGPKSSPTLHIDPVTGRVGIGLLAPSAPMHVVTSDGGSGSRAVFGHATATSGEVVGVFGQTDSPSGSGVEGIATATTGNAAGVRGVSAAGAGRGVHGIATATGLGTSGVGVLGESMSSSFGKGVHGIATTGTGVEGVASSAGGIGVRAAASSTSGSNRGLWASTSSAAGFAGYFTGPVGSRSYFERGVAIGTTNPTAFFQVVAPSGAGPKVIMPGFSTIVAGEAYTITGGFGYTLENVTGGVVFGGEVDGGENLVTDAYGTVSGGQANRAGNLAGSLSDAPYATVSGGQSNTAAGGSSTVGGGISNSANGTAATVAGGAGNVANATHATVGGGHLNIANSIASTVSGGLANEALVMRATVGGGFTNRAAGEAATVAGGEFNEATSARTTVGGGSGNSAKATNSTVSGGATNTAAGNWSTVPGGLSNVAGGNYSFAAGRQAHVRTPLEADNFTGDAGTFVWADSIGSPFVSSGSNQFLVRASGGVGIGTNTPDSFVHLEGGTIATTSPGSGTLQIGPTDDWNLLFGSNNRMIARFQGALAPMNIQASSVRIGPQGNAFATLHVEGSAGFPGFRIRYGGSTKLNHTENGGLNIGSAGIAPDNGLRVLGQSLLLEAVGVGRTPAANILEVEGNASKTTAGSWLANSDARIKTEVRDLDDALDLIGRVRPVAFRYSDEYRRAHPSIEDLEYFNVLAQEFAVVFPDAVTESGDRLADREPILQVDTYPMLIHAVAAIQQLRVEKDAQIESLEAMVAAQQTALERLAARLAAIEAAIEGE